MQRKRKKRNSVLCEKMLPHPPLKVKWLVPNVLNRNILFSQEWEESDYLCLQRYQSKLKKKLYCFIFYYVTKNNVGAFLCVTFE